MTWQNGQVNNYISFLFFFFSFIFFIFLSMDAQEKNDS